MTGPRRLSDFEGVWRVERAIDDRLTGGRAMFTGEVRFMQEAGGLRYDEVGTLTLASGQAMRAERRYHWSSDGDLIVVAFADRRPFHSFRLKERSVGTRHPCGNDLYDVSYDFTAWPRWSAVWRVNGPRKDYVSTTHFTWHGLQKSGE